MKQNNYKNFYFAGNVIKSVFLTIIIICDMSSYSSSTLLSNNVRKFSCTGICLDSGCIKWAYNLQIDQSTSWESTEKTSLYIEKWLIPLAAQSEASVCGCLLARILVLNPPRVMDVCLLWVLCVVSRGVCIRLITRPGEYCRVCVCVRAPLNVIVKPW